MMFDELKKYTLTNGGLVKKDKSDKCELISIKLDDRVYFGVEVYRSNISFGLQDLKICELDRKVVNNNLLEPYSIFIKNHIADTEYNYLHERQYEIYLLQILQEINNSKEDFLHDYYSSLSCYQIPTFFRTEQILKHHCTAVYFGLLNLLLTNSNITTEMVDNIVNKHFRPGFGSVIIMQQIDFLKSYLNKNNK